MPISDGVAHEFQKSNGENEMTREEQIKEKAKEMFPEVKTLEALSVGIQGKLEEMAEWADANPSDETIEKILTLYEKWLYLDYEHSTDDHMGYIKRHWND